MLRDDVERKKRLNEDTGEFFAIIRVSVRRRLDVHFI